MTLSKVAIGLFAATIVLSLVAYSQFGTAANFAAQQGQLQNAEFALSIGFSFVFAALAAAFVGISEYMADRRQRELRRLIQNRP